VCRLHLQMMSLDIATRCYQFRLKFHRLFFIQKQKLLSLIIHVKYFIAHDVTHKYFIVHVMTEKPVFARALDVNNKNWAGIKWKKRVWHPPQLFSSFCGIKFYIFFFYQKLMILAFYSGWRKILSFDPFHETWWRKNFLSCNLTNRFD
jgi:hypothetical protein